MSPSRLVALVLKELRELYRDPTTLALCALMPMVLLFLFGYAVNIDVEDVRLGVYDHDRTPASRRLLDRFSATEYFSLHRQFASPAELEAALRRADVRVALVIPTRFEARLLKGEPAPVQVLVDGTHSATSSLAAAYANAIVSSYPSPMPRGIERQVRAWYNPSMRSVNFIVPGLFAVILMAFPPLLTALAIVREKETGTIEQIYASPVTSAEFIVGKLVPYGLVAFLQMLLVIALGYFWFDVPFRGSLALMLGASLLYVLTTVGIGLLVSSMVRTQLVAMFMALMLTLMPSFLFSGFLFPIFTMPAALQIYSRVFPASYFTEISRGVVLKGVAIDVLWPNLALLALYTAAVFVLSASRLKQKVA